MGCAEVRGERGRIVQARTVAWRRIYSVTGYVANGVQRWSLELTTIGATNDASQVAHHASGRRTTAARASNGARRVDALAKLAIGRDVQPVAAIALEPREIDGIT